MRKEKAAGATPGRHGAPPRHVHPAQASLVSPQASLISPQAVRTAALEEICLWPGRTTAKTREPQIAVGSGVLGTLSKAT